MVCSTHKPLQDRAQPEHVHGDGFPQVGVGAKAAGARGSSHAPLRQSEQATVIGPPGDSQFSEPGSAAPATRAVTGALAR